MKCFVQKKSGYDTPITEAKSYDVAEPASRYSTIISKETLRRDARLQEHGSGQSLISDERRRHGDKINKQPGGQ